VGEFPVVCVEVGCQTLDAPQDPPTIPEVGDIRTEGKIHHVRVPAGGPSARLADVDDRVSCSLRGPLNKSERRRRRRRQRDERTSSESFTNVKGTGSEGMAPAGNPVGEGRARGNTRGVRASALSCPPPLQTSHPSP